MNALPPVYVVQRDFAVGDIGGNRDKLIAASKAAARAGAKVALAPELALSGYPPEDLLYDRCFADALERALREVSAAAEPSVALLFGAPLRKNGKLFNAAVLARGGRIEGVYAKARLPNFSVFDEERYFSAGGAPLVFSVAGEKFAAQICEDIWHPQQPARVRKTGAAHTLALNGSPFCLGKHERRLRAAAEFARRSQTSVFYCNAVGGQDELIFDGASFAADKNGKTQFQMPALSESAKVINACAAKYPKNEDALLYNALVLAVRDFVAKTGFASGVVLGLSGGIDSALVAAIAADALGARNVATVMMPSRYTSAESVSDAAQIAANIQCEHFVLPINKMAALAEKNLSPRLQKREGDVTMENVQSRLRGLLLMALANNRGLLPLATGNKSEAACGYATLYGDMCGGFAPLKDLSKTRVWRLAKHRNRRGEIIPPRVIARPPTAELKPGQTDQDSLPPYDVVDGIIAAHLEHRLAPEDIRREFSGEDVARVLSLLAGSEHKRRQSAIGPKLTECAFGRDWRMPVASRFRRFDAR